MRGMLDVLLVDTLRGGQRLGATVNVKVKEESFLDLEDAGIEKEDTLLGSNCCH